MKTLLITILLSTLLMTTQAQPQYPTTKKVDTTNEYFGTKVADLYRWLEDDKSDETKAWVTAQNKISFGLLEKIPYQIGRAHV